MKYCGGWSKGKFHGMGDLKILNDERYIGEFVQDARHGKGFQQGKDGKWKEVVAMFDKI
jgi:hypothetical protein